MPWEPNGTPWLLRGEAPEVLTWTGPAPDDEGLDGLAPAIDPGVNLQAFSPNGVGIAYGETFSLHSNPTSTYKVYLDFDGHTTSGTPWNGSVASFDSAAFTTDASASFSAAELDLIQQIWQRVAEYFSPFNIDVTTEDPGAGGLSRTGSTDATFGIRVVITDSIGSGGGVAKLGSFDWDAAAGSGQTPKTLPSS